MRLAIDNVAVRSESVGRFASNLKTIFGVFHQIVNVRVQVVRAERCFVYSIQFGFGEPSHFVRFDWNVIVQRFIPLQFDLMAGDRDNARIEHGAQYGRFGGKCDLCVFGRMLVERCLTVARRRMHITVRLEIGNIDVDVSIDVGVYRIRNTVQRMDLNGIRCDRFQIVDGQFGVIECFAGRNEDNV